MLYTKHMTDTSQLLSNRPGSSSKGTLFLTGGSNGIGQQILSSLANHYHNVYSYDAQQGKDVRDCKNLAEAMASTLSPELQNDLVLSAGVFRPVDFLTQSQADIDFVVDTNLKGTLYAAQAFLQWHKQVGHPIPPNIVIISSISAFYHGGRANVAYDATKAALSFMVKDLANFDCVANAIEPGTVRETKIGSWTPQFTHDDEARQIIERGQASDVEKLGREVGKADVARIAQMLLLQNETGAINGTCITVDAGLTVMRQRF